MTFHTPIKRTVRFHATCHKVELVDILGVVVTCDETWDGADGAAAYVEHMTKVHRLSIFGNTNTPAPYHPQGNFRSKPGTLPPTKKRRDALLAAMVS